MSDLLREFEQEVVSQAASFPDFKAGDTINVHVKIKEGTKERIQQFQGTVIQRKGGSSSVSTFTVRKVSNGIGIERIFPTFSPNISKVEVILRGTVRRARLYYLRGLQGKAARIREKIKK